MSMTFQPYNPDQTYLFPPDMREWLPEGHFAYHVSDLVDALDLSPFYEWYEVNDFGDLDPHELPHDPKMLVKVLIYGYATGELSSRNLVRKLEEDVAYRVLAAGNTPDYLEVAEFRDQFVEEIKSLFVDAVQLAFETGVTNFGKLSIGGTQAKAKASKRKENSYGQMIKQWRRLRSKIGDIVERSRRLDMKEDTQYGMKRQGNELPEHLRKREDRLVAIKAAVARLKEEAQENAEADKHAPGKKSHSRDRRA